LNDYLDEARRAADTEGALFRPVSNNRTRELDKTITPDGVYKLMRRYDLALKIGAHALRAPPTTPTSPRSRNGLGKPTSPRRVDREGLDAHLDLEQSSLPAGNFHFRAIAKLRMQAPIHAELHILDKIQIDNLLAIGPKETIRIEPPFKRCERAPQQGMCLAP
jgi:hypothetical protein